MIGATNRGGQSRELAHSFVDAGAEIVIGSHPHVVQITELYKEKRIYYSLGNFVFDQYFSTSTKTGLGINLTFKEKEIGIHILPIVGEKSQVALMLEEKSVIFMENWLAKSRLESQQFDNFDLQINL